MTKHDITNSAIVARTSTHEQALDGTSLDRQVDEARRFAERHGWRVASEYIERGVSGATPLDERPEITTLLQDAAAGKFQAVIWYKLDRLGRSMSKSLDLIEQLEGLGCEVRSVSEDLDSSTPSGSLFRDLLLRFAEFERDTIRTRVMEGAFDTAESGKVPGGQVPFGFANEGGRVVENPAEAAVIRRAYELRAAGASMPDIAKTFNAEGFRPRPKIDRKATKAARLVDPDSLDVHLEQRFNSSSIQHYIANPAYMGKGITRELAVSGARNAPKRVFEFDTPVLVTPELWARANSPRPKGRRIRNAGKRVNLYSLGERIYHEHDVGERVPMFGHTRYEGHGEDRRVLRFYRCTASRSTVERPAYCPGLGVAYGHTLSSVDASRIEALVLRWMLETLQDRDRLEEYIRRADASLSAQDGSQVDVDALASQLTALNVKKSRYIESYAEQLLDRKELDTRIAVVQAEIDVITAAIVRTKDVDAARAALHVSLDDLLSMPINRDGERDPNADEEPPRGSSQWWHELRDAALGAMRKQPYGRSPGLPKWVVAEARHLTQILAVEVVVSVNDGSSWHPDGANPAQWPTVVPSFAPARALQSATGSQITPS